MVNIGFHTIPGSNSYSGGYLPEHLLIKYNMDIKHLKGQHHMCIIQLNLLLLLLLYFPALAYYIALLNQ